jgi:hypothetical protein
MLRNFCLTPKITDSQISRSRDWIDRKPKLGRVLRSLSRMVPFGRFDLKEDSG